MWASCRSCHPDPRLVRVGGTGTKVPVGGGPVPLGRHPRRRHSGRHEDDPDRHRGLGNRSGGSRSARPRPRRPALQRARGGGLPVRRAVTPPCLPDRRGRRRHRDDQAHPVPQPTPPRGLDHLRGPAGRASGRRRQHDPPSVRLDRGGPSSRATRTSNRPAWRSWPIARRSSTRAPPSRSGPLPDVLIEAITHWMATRDGMGRCDPSLSSR